MRSFRYRKQLSALCVLLLFSSTACIKNANLTAPQLATYQINRTIAALAEANKAVASTAIKLNQLQVLNPATTNVILNYNRDVANAVKASVAVLQSGKSWDAAAPEVLRLLQEIPLPEKMSAFLNNPATDQGVLAMVSVIRTTQILIAQGIVEVKR